MGRVHICFSNDQWLHCIGFHLQKCVFSRFSCAERSTAAPHLKPDAIASVTIATVGRQVFDTQSHSIEKHSITFHHSWLITWLLFRANTGHSDLQWPFCTTLCTVQQQKASSAAKRSTRIKHAAWLTLSEDVFKPVISIFDQSLVARETEMAAIPRLPYLERLLNVFNETLLSAFAFPPRSSATRQMRRKENDQPQKGKTDSIHPPVNTTGGTKTNHQPKTQMKISLKFPGSFQTCVLPKSASSRGSTRTLQQAPGAESCPSSSVDLKQSGKSPNLALTPAFRALE